MPTYYVGPGGNDGNTGLSWAQRKLTLNGVEDIPVVAGDTVYVGPGVYREQLTVDVSGTAGSPITYIGDYTGANTDGVGGVVRITGSNDDQTITRTSGIYDNGSRNYRTFTGFLLDNSSVGMIFANAAGTNWIIDKCCFVPVGTNSRGIVVNGASQSAWIIQNCHFDFSPNASGNIPIYFLNAATVDNTGHYVQNCIIDGGGAAIQVSRIGGIIVRNCIITKNQYGIQILTALNPGQTLTVNNCIIYNAVRGFNAVAADGSFVENYNSVSGTYIPYTNVVAGANTNAYPPLLDTRPFFEMVNGGRLVSPYDLSQWSQLINVAGTNPTVTDMRGTGAIGGVREWGPLEYDPTLKIAGGGGGGPVIGSRIIRGLSQ